MDKEKLNIIDIDSLIYIHSYNLREDDDFFNHKESILNHIIKMCNATECSKYMGFLTIGRNFRYDIAKIKPYKGNRKKIVKPKFFYDYQQYLIEELGCTFHTDLEADDLCKIANNRYKEQYDIIVSTTDKDLKQFPATFYNYKKEIFEVVDTEQAEYNLWKQVLTGDTADNILGLRNIGDVKATKLLEGVSYQNLKNVVYNAYIEHLGLPNGVVSLAENLQLIYLLEDYDFGEEELFNIRSIEDKINKW